MSTHDKAVAGSETDDASQIIGALRKLGGNSVTDDSLVFEGQRFVIPEKLGDVSAAIKFLKQWKEQNEEPFEITKIFKYKAWDGAAAFDRAVRSLTGMGGFGQKVHGGFFAPDQLPEYRTVQTGLYTEMQVPWGHFGIPMLECAVAMHSVDGMFAMQVTAPRMMRAAIDGLFAMVQNELEEASIYRGKAIDGGFMPNFIDVASVDFEKVVYSDEVQLQLDANVWGAIRHADTLESLGVATKRAVLFEGDYGTGKTLAAFRTAKIAVDHGWTFVYCRPGVDNYAQALETAQMYQPSVIFFEDIDTMSDATDSGTSRNEISVLLDKFDGIQSKGVKMLAVMTTNHADRIHKGMVRPGRLDAVIHIGALDRHGIETLISKTVAADRLSDDVDYDRVYEEMAGFVPAFAREAIDRAIRYALTRTGGDRNFLLTTDDLCAAAIGLQPQLALMLDASEGDRLPTLDESLRQLMTTMQVDVDRDGDGVGIIRR